MKEKIVFGLEMEEFKNKDNKVIYNLSDVQKFIEKMKKEKITPLPELILALFYAQKHQPIRGMILLMKEGFLLQKEFAVETNTKIEDAEFFPYKYGPYSLRIDNIIRAMENYGIIITVGRKSSNKEIFYLSKEGEKRAKEVFEKLSEEQQEKLKNLRKGWDQLGVKGILKLVYKKYDEYTNKSEIRKQILRNEEAERMRG